MSSESELIGYPEPGGLRTGGHSGTDTSRERAIREAMDGTKAQREKDTIWLLGTRRGNGLTVKELRDLTGMHHGQASSVLSTLHKVGRVDRLNERRDRCLVYVLHGFAGERETQPHGRRKARDREALYAAFEAGFRLGSDSAEGWHDPLVRLMFEKWEEQR